MFLVFKFALLLRLPWTLTPPGSSNITSVISTFPLFLSSKKLYHKTYYLSPCYISIKSTGKFFYGKLPILKSIKPNIKSVIALADFVFLAVVSFSSSSIVSSTTDAMSSESKYQKGNSENFYTIDVNAILLFLFYYSIRQQLVKIECKCPD